MIGEMLDNVVGVFSPLAKLQRVQARRVLRSYQGAEPTRLTGNKKPLNQSADTELSGPFGADSMRSWARMLVRDNAYAWGVVDTIVSSVVGTGIKGQSQIETRDGEDVENVNEARDKVWSEWCRVCDVNGQYTLDEMQALVQREIVEAGECLVHLMDVPLVYRGIKRPVPLALELIEADRLASDHDTYNRPRSGENRIVRGIEQDDLGRPIAYHVYKNHPTDPFGFNRDIERIPAKDIRHLFKRDRIGQSRGISWFAPVLSWLRDLATYVDNELQASAVASCFTVAIKSERGIPGLSNSVSEEESTDSSGNRYEYLQPGMIMNLGVNESIESANPGRPNSAAEPWINLMLRGIAVGTGLSYETVARDYSQTSYSSSRTSQLEDRRRFRRWQRYLIEHLLEPVHDRFSEAAATAGLKDFATMTDILDDRETVTAFEWQPQEWEWVDPQNEQAASSLSIADNQSTHQSEQAKVGKHWRTTFYQRAKEEKLRIQLGLLTAEERQQAATASVVGQQSGFPQAATTDQQQAAVEPGSSEWMGLSRLQLKNNRKALTDILNGLADGSLTPVLATAQLSMIGMSKANIEALISDAADGAVDEPMPATEVLANA